MNIKKTIPIVTVILLLGSCQAPLPVFPIGGDFQAIDANGNKFKLSKMPPGNKLLFFGYTHCPDFCPITLSKLSAVMAKVEKPERFTVLYMSVDHERDTPARLKKYTSNFKYNIMGLTGSPAEIQTATKLYKAHFEKVKSTSKLGYLIDHTTRVYLIDNENRVRHAFRYPDPVTLYLDILGRI